MGMEQMLERKEVPPEFSEKEIVKKYGDASEKAYAMLTDEERSAIENVPKVDERDPHDGNWNYMPDHLGHPVEYAAYEAAQEKFRALQREAWALVNAEVGAKGKMMNEQHMAAKAMDKERDRTARIARKAAEAGLSPEAYIASKKEGAKQ